MSRLIPIEKIDVPRRQRSFDPAWAEALGAMYLNKEPVPAIGVSPDGDRFRLVFGLHRLEGAKGAGLTAIPAEEIKLDERDLEASAAWHEALENLMRRELNALDRMAHLSAAKASHDRLFPQAARRGPKTRSDEDNSATFAQFGFAKSVAEQVGFSESLIKNLIAAYRKFEDRTLLRLQGTWLADKQSELFALSKFEPVRQKTILDYLLSSPPQASNVADAVALIEERARPDAVTRKVARYAETLKTMPVEHRDRIFDAAEEAIRDYAHRRGWL